MANGCIAIPFRCVSAGYFVTCMIHQKLTIMKSYHLIFALLILFSNCTTPDPEVEKAEAIKAIDGFYSAMTDFDYEAIPTFCTDNFYAVDDGKIFENLDEFIALLKTYEGAHVEIDLQVEKAKTDAKSALIILIFEANITMGEEQMNVKAIENYLLKKENGKWLIDFIQSTPLIRTDNITYKSEHLLKVPEDFPVSDLKASLQEINNVIAELGYPECGYQIYGVQNDNEENYTHVFEGKWLTQDNYTTIHEHPKYKEVTKKYASNITEIMKGQTYLRVGK
jgi:hypothetical protein